MKTLNELLEENDKLKRLCRFQWLTLGYYSTPFNYDDNNIAYHPLTGQAASGIKADGGDQAKRAQEVAKKLGFDSDTICSWPGPGVNF